jgi:hypothetical protein
MAWPPPRAFDPAGGWYKKKAAPCGRDRSTKLQSGRPKRARTDTARDGGKESALNSSRAATNARVRPTTHFRKLAANGTFAEMV